MELKLPTERNKPLTEPWQFSYHLSGVKKIGKTRFSIEGCEEIVLQMDRPSQGFEAREVYPKNWEQFKSYINLIEKQPVGTYQRIIVDGISELYDMCTFYVCNPLGYAGPGEADDYGATWGKVKKEFRNQINKLSSMQTYLQVGLIFISHADWKDLDSLSGKAYNKKEHKNFNKISKLVSTLPKQAYEVINGKFSANFFMVMEEDRRKMIIQGSENCEAGHSMEHNFLEKDGSYIASIDMGENVSEGYANFLKAFYNGNFDSGPNINSSTRNETNLPKPTLKKLNSTLEYEIPTAKTANAKRKITIRRNK